MRFYPETKSVIRGARTMAAKTATELASLSPARTDLRNRIGRIEWGINMMVQQTLGADNILRCAHLSEDGRYRYRLERTWNPERGCVLFVMLNPSTADDLKDDNTITKCMRFTKEWGYGGLVVANLFAYRSPRPQSLREVVAPVGPENDMTLVTLADMHKMIICAWGNDGELKGRDGVVFDLLTAGNRQVHCLQETGKGNPYHPRNVPYGTTQRQWGGPPLTRLRAASGKIPQRS